MERPRSSRGARMLPAECYTSPEVMEREVERIFHRRWLYAGHLSELPEAGSYFLFEQGSDNVVVVRDGADAVHAFHNVCRHRGSILCREATGTIPGKLQCHYHAWTYGLDGRLLAAPNMHEVAGFELADWPLRAVATAVWRGFVFLNFAAEPEPFEKSHAALFSRFQPWHLSELASAHRTVYDVEANWKLLYQNYSECYHCPVAHPLLNKLTPYRNSWNDLDEGLILGGPMKMSRGGGSMTMDGLRCAPPLGEVAGEDLNLVYYYTIFPNMFLSLHPDYVLVHRLQPLAPARTRIRCDWFFDRRLVGGPELDPSRAVAFWDMTNRQDWELVTGAQRGVTTSGYVPGPYSELESQLAAFDRNYLAVMGEDAPSSRAATG